MPHLCKAKSLDKPQNNLPAQLKMEMRETKTSLRFLSPPRAILICAMLLMTTSPQPPATRKVRNWSQKETVAS